MFTCSGGCRSSRPSSSATASPSQGTRPAIQKGFSHAEAKRRGTKFSGSFGDTKGEAKKVGSWVGGGGCKMIWNP